MGLPRNECTYNSRASVRILQLRLPIHSPVRLKITGTRIHFKRSIALSPIALFYDKEYFHPSLLRIFPFHPRIPLNILDLFDFHAVFDGCTCLASSEHHFWTLSYFRMFKG